MADEVKSSGIAIVLSFLWTGLGQLYAGRVGRGLVMMIATPIVWSMAFMSACYSCAAGAATVGSLAVPQATGPDALHPAAAGGITAVSLVGASIGLIWWVWGMLDAKKLCEAYNAGTARQP